MTTQPYGLICPISHACDLLQPRWTIPILSAMWGGATRFNEIKREIGSVSPALLSKRLRELEEAGLVERIEDKATGAVDYIRTPSAIELEPMLNELAMWAQRHIKAKDALANLNVSNLMWRMRKYILREQLPDRRVVIQFRFEDEGLDYDTYWALINPGAETEMCTSIPGYGVDLYVETHSRTLSCLLLGRSTVARELEAGRLFLSGDALLARTMQRWLYVTEYADQEGVLDYAAE